MTEMLSVPKLLRELLEQGRWLHPGDDVLKGAFPSLTDPLEFCAAIDGRPISTYLGWPSASSEWTVFRMYADRNPRPLPWLDAHLAVFLAVNRVPGDDVAIALDFRGDLNAPAVVASHWPESGSEWVLLAESFDAFWRAVQPVGDRP